MMNQVWYDFKETAREIGCGVVFVLAIVVGVVYNSVTPPTPSPIVTAAEKNANKVDGEWLSVKGDLRLSFTKKTHVVELQNTKDENSSASTGNWTTDDSGVTFHVTGPAGIISGPFHFVEVGPETLLVPEHPEPDLSDCFRAIQED